MNAKETVLITGASGGIGLALASVFAEAGHDLVLVARNAAKLRAAAKQLETRYGVDVTPITRDLTEPDAARALQRSVQRRKRKVSVLINNAGAMLTGGFSELTLGAQLSLLQLNVVVPTQLTHLFLPSMIERGHGRILNVASIAAFQPLSRLAVYAASKAYLLHFTEALSEELRDSGVTATTLCPGFTATDMMSSAGDTGWLPSFAVSSAEEVARDGYRACMNGDAVHVSGAANQLITELLRHQPRWVMRALSGWASRRYS